MKEIIDKLDFIKIKNVCYVQNTVKKLEKNHMLGENICKRISDRGLLSKIYKELLKLNNNKMNNRIKIGQKPEQTTHQRRYVDGR